ncbi:MAG: YeeE/YedE family protein [Polyangiaceae bacterium]|nr:YeeE/YedE family protein [Polyangiaceae bacterium]
MKENWLTGAAGLLLGFSLSRIGFSSWDEVHKMFVFSDLRLFLTFIAAVVILAVAWPIARKFRSGRMGNRPIHKGTIIGGALFGIGWAVSGACPAIGLVQIGEGQLGALWTLAGILLGNWLYSVVHERYFRWSAASCVDD